MEFYKSLNSVLVAKVQELKIKNRELKLIINSLKGQLLDQHAAHTIQKNKLVNIILLSIGNYRDVLKEVDPLINIDATFDHTLRGNRTSSSRRQSTRIFNELPTDPSPSDLPFRNDPGPGVDNQLNEENDDVSERIDSDSSLDFLLRHKNKSPGIKNRTPQESETTIQESFRGLQVESFRDLRIGQERRSENEKDQVGNDDSRRSADSEICFGNSINLPLSSTSRTPSLTPLTDDSQNNVSSRSQRSCKPTNLKEPSLKIKLRSENPLRPANSKRKK